MQYTSDYPSPIGHIFLSADDIGLTGVQFEPVQGESEAAENQAILEAKRWLDVYFSGREPDFTPPMYLVGTAFQREVWEILGTIPYGQSTSYGAIARQIAARRGIPRMSAQAVGGAVGRNPIGILIPCHRVLGADGSLTGYSGGLNRKRKLLQLEHIFFVDLPQGI